MSYFRWLMKACAKSLFLTAGLLLAALTQKTYAQGGVPLWTNVSSGAVSALAVDSNGNVFVTGQSYNGSNADYATIKYSNTGTPLWTNLYNGQANLYDAADAVAVDASGNVFVTGQSVDDNNTSSAITLAYSNAGAPLWTNRSSGSGLAMAVDGSGNVFLSLGALTIKFSNAGLPLWTNRYGFDARTLALDSSGNVFVWGFASNGSNGNSVTIKYSNAGLSLWTNRYNGGFTYYPSAIAVDKSADVYVTGYSHTDSSFFTDYATIKYSGTGVPLWTNRFDGPGHRYDQPSAIAVDGNGNVLVTGDTTTLVSNNDSYDYATIKYSNSGTPLWTNLYDGPASDWDRTSAIAVDAAGNVFVTGFSIDAPCCPQIGALETIAYSNAGDLIWENRYYGPDNRTIYPRGIAVDRAGNVIVTGYSGDGGASSSYSTTIKYSSSVPPPVLLNFQRLNNQLLLSWTNAGFHLQSAPAVSGTFTNVPGATSPYTNSMISAQRYFRLAAPYSSLPPLVHLDYQKLNNQLVLSWTNAGFNLQTAPAVTGTFTNVPGATSPYTNSTISAQRYFRLAAP